MVLRRAAALANAVGATRLAQGGAKILITLGRDSSGYQEPSTY